MFPVNLGRFGNSIAIWLAIEPYELFFYIFLPPLLFDAAVRIDFFLFKKVCQQPSLRLVGLPTCTRCHESQDPTRTVLTGSHAGCSKSCKC